MKKHIRLISIVTFFVLLTINVGLRRLDTTGQWNDSNLLVNVVTTGFLTAVVIGAALLVSKWRRRHK